MFGLGPTEAIVIGIVAVMLFGSKLPDVARQLGGSYREFRRGLNEVQQQFRDAEYEARKSFSIDDKPLSQERQEDEDSAEPSAPKFTPPK